MAQPGPSEPQGGSLPHLTIGSWPGREAGQNRFSEILLGALETAGARIVSFPDSRSICLDGLDVLIVHWPERVFGEAANAWEAAGLMLSLLGKLRRRPAAVKVVWVVHNLRPHLVRGFKRLSWPWYFGALSRSVDGALTLSQGTESLVRRAFPVLARKPLGHFWHPFYPDEEISPPGRAIQRVALGWEEAGTVYGYCGQIRPNKGVDRLIAAFRDLPDPRARLLVAGPPLGDSGIAKALRTLAGEDPRIRLHLQDLTEEEFQASLGACDIIVAPFRSYLHSGSLVHALSCRRPVLTPATPFATSLAAHLASPGWIQTYTGPLTASVLAAAELPKEPIHLAPLAPAKAAEDIIGFLQALAGRKTLPLRKAGEGDLQGDLPVGPGGPRSAGGSVDECRPERQSRRTEPAMVPPRNGLTASAFRLPSATKPEGGSGRSRQVKSGS